MGVVHVVSFFDNRRRLGRCRREETSPADHSRLVWFTYSEGSVATQSPARPSLPPYSHSSRGMLGAALLHHQLSGPFPLSDTGKYGLALGGLWLALCSPIYLHFRAQAGVKLDV